MPGARDVVVGIALIGMALSVQGCWDSEEDRFTLLGEGVCRTTDGGQGAFTTVAAASLEECQAQCLDDNGSCRAIEYITNNGNCELHSAPITKYANADGVGCYVTK
jgi:PAN domain